MRFEKQAVSPKPPNLDDIWDSVKILLAESDISMEDFLAKARAELVN
jgi:hypothetical protein